MGHTLFCVLSLFLLNTLFYGKAEDKPKPVLTVSPLWPSPGASVTLSCRVEVPSAGWRFYWYKAVPNQSEYSYSYELLPGNTNGTEQDSYIVHGPTHTAGYVCRAGRGDPVYYTQYSEPKFVWSGDFHPSASLTVSPDRVQHFKSDSVSLSCEGNSTEWRVMRFREGGYLSHCSSWGRMTGSTCKIDNYWPSNAVYWCESGSGDFSNAVNITGNYHIILLSPVRPVAEGESVTLGCKLRPEDVLTNVSFYKNDKLIQNDTRRELTIPAVSKSHEGFYKCERKDSPQAWRTWTSPESWMSVKSASRPKSSSLPVPLIVVGLVCGILLIILLLLLLFCCRKSKDSGFIRSQSTNQSSATDDMINQAETQCNKSNSHLHGDVCLYESIKGPEDTETDESRDVTYTFIDLKNFAKLGKNNKEESRVNSDVSIGSAAAAVSDDTLMYAQIYSHNKESTPAAADETVYSEVKPGRARDLKRYQPYQSESTSRISNTIHEVNQNKTQPNEYPSPLTESTVETFLGSTTTVSVLDVGMGHTLFCVLSLFLLNTLFYGKAEDKPKPVLTVSPLWPSPGASVTLSCRVEVPSAGWRFYWYKAVPNQSKYSYSYELLPGNTNGTEQDSYIVHGPTHTAGYVCRAGRGDPVYYTQRSEPKFVWSGDFHPSASLTVSPDRVQHFKSDSVSLSCEGNSTEWRVMRFPKGRYLSHCSSWGRMTGSTCKMDYWSSNAVYWCESGSGEFSNAVNITGNYDIILLSPVRPVAEGESVTLGCKLRTEDVLTNVSFYKNDKLIQNDTRRELTIPAVSKSHEGFYKCERKDSPQARRTWTSPESWMSVKSASRPKSSSLPVPLIVVGLVCGILLIILLLLLLFCCRKSKDSGFIRSQSTNQSSATDDMINQAETQCNKSTSHLHGKNNKEESRVNSDVSIGSAAAAVSDDTLMYAQIYSHNKESTPAAADETVYSEVKPGRARDLKRYQQNQWNG
ncbi:uncharacterized protein si:dkey-10h3.1 [Xiphias gladius]|uniref:uncharacterized protein si:dkey-10h3.1 n=1 Tax=Xiphias gladius TaxID=8245 RepID=UPI001A98AE60|nr:uncharacterized protein si:dkey-10h3.1 [Xiphias gladius]